MDRTPLQRMLVASVLHAQLGPQGGYIPPSVKDLAALEGDPLGLQSQFPDTTSRSATASLSRGSQVERDAYAEFSTLGKLPDDLLDSPKPQKQATGQSTEWHAQCQSGAVSEADTEAVKSFVDSFETVLSPACLPHAVCAPFFITATSRSPAAAQWQRCSVRKARSMHAPLCSCGAA